MGQSLTASKMKSSIAFLFLFSAVAGTQGLNVETTPARDVCIGFECPNDNEEVSAMQPRFLRLQLWSALQADVRDPLVFDETAQVCNWCYNMCDKCSDCGGCP